MAEKPPEMYRNGRPKVDITPEERLYRRVRPEDWGEPHVDVDALDLPDMSVNRGRPIGDPLWVLLEEDDHCTWGIVYFVAGEIPTPMTHQDGTVYRFEAVHAPREANYPHSEIWAYRGDQHIQGRRYMDPDLSLRWRNALLQRTRNFRWPSSE